MPRRTVLAWVLLLSLGALASQARALNIRVIKGEHCPYRIITPRFSVEFSLTPDEGKQYAVLCEKGYQKLGNIFGVPSDRTVWKGRCHVYLFKNHSEFVVFARTVHQSDAGMMSGGYTRIMKQDPEIVLFLHENSHVKLQQTLVHEMTHVFLQLFYKEAMIPTWVHEGCAQFFEFQHYPKQSRLKDSKEFAKKMVADSSYYPFSTFAVLGFPPTDFKGYAQAWSMLDFMINGKKGGSQRTSRFILLLKGRKSQEDALGGSFGCDFARFEEAWKQYVQTAYTDEEPEDKPMDGDAQADDGKTKDESPKPEKPKGETKDGAKAR